MSTVRRVRKLSLQVLYELYLFPQSDTAVAQALAAGPLADARREEIRDAFSYLEKKGYIALQRGRNDAVTAQITPFGIDIVEGAAIDRGILPVGVSSASLSGRRSSRRWILSFLRQFPESFSGDDEIHAEFVDQGMGPALLDRIRFDLWYLAGKQLVDLKTHPVAGDVVYVARITASGIDLLDGTYADPGVLTHG
jgi:hypothetical protein